MFEVFRPEVLERGDDRTCCTISESAERSTHDVVAEIEQLVEILWFALTILKVLERLNQPPGSLAAGCALSA